MYLYHAPQPKPWLIFHEQVVRGSYNQYWAERSDKLTIHTPLNGVHRVVERGVESQLVQMFCPVLAVALHHFLLAEYQPWLNI